MKSQHWELKVQALVDGELESGERLAVEAAVAKDPRLEGLYRELLATSRALKSSEPLRVLPIRPEFYTAGIMARLEPASARAGEGLGRARIPEPARLFWRWLAPAGALALLILILARPFSPTETGREKQALWTTHELDLATSELSADEFYSSREGITVVWVQGHDLR